MTTSLHATTVLIGERAVLLRGPSGSGKSSLALRFLTRPPMNAESGAPVLVRLVADDRTVVEARGGRLLARAHRDFGGLIEVRGQGIRRVRYESAAVVGLVADLVEGPRIPPVDGSRVLIAGVFVPCVAVSPLDRDVAGKVLAALTLDHANA